uniref:Uncharacterized protein n=1 Tax=Strombidium rassoulzadegani TaxID=1082188 RepID=A0A7S3FXT2_9SPIT|mmetsp:Transcript_8260/g.13822  ORF Transcript_8260/g.13822 Transcript_8260/m.13822 type:complete len:181 (+) Transcript_8260:34-576(+)
MANRGIRQLKNIRIYFCDIGGSSEGVRQTLASQEFVDYVQGNTHLNFEVLMRRGHHPYMSTTFINGFVKDIPLRNAAMDHALSHMQQVNQEFGRYGMKHNQKRVIGAAKSLQGGWRNDDMWNNYPQHLQEAQREQTMTYFEPLPMKSLEMKSKRRQPDYFTRMAKKRYPLVSSIRDKNEI